jgi:glutathione S-transferase
MLTIYHSPMTRGLRVIWACEELGIAYQVKAVDFSAAYRATEEWRALNPVGKVPVMTDGDLTMFESGAMLQYVLDRYGNGRLQPRPGTPEHALYLQWCWFGESTFSRPIGEVVNHRRAFPDAPDQAIMDEMRDRGLVSLAALDQALAGRPFILGDEFSGADIMNAYTVLLVERVLGAPLPANAARWWADMKARDGYRATRQAEKDMACAGRVIK